MEYGGVDPETENMEMWSPYASNYDNPILYKDPLGNAPDCCGGLLGALADLGDKITVAVVGVAVGVLHSYSGGSISNNPWGYRDNLRTGDRQSAYDFSVFVGQASTWMPVPVGGGRKVPGANPEFVTPGGGKVKVETSLSSEPQVPSTKEISSNQNTGGGRGSNNRKPDPNATGDHSVFDNNGNTTYKQNSKNPTGFDEVKRVDVKGKAHLNKDGTSIPTPHVHEKGVKDVKSAIPGQDFFLKQ